MSWLSWADLLGWAAILALATDWLFERRRLRAFVTSLQLDPRAPDQVVRTVARVLADRPRSGDDPAYLSPLLAPFGATVRGVLRDGACCSGYTRLAILVLATLRIPSAQVTVYHRSRQARHCLIEARIDGRPMIVDPLFAIAYVSPDGLPLGIEDLQAGARVRFEPLRPAGRPGYPPNGYYDFDFSLTKTANWTKSWPRRTAYSILRRMTAGGIDRLRVPATLEWPQTLLMAALAGVLSVGHLAVSLLT